MSSREEARRLEFSFVQPEHLFLGIIHDRIGIISLVLGKLGVDLRKARRVVERLIGRGYSNTPLENVSFTVNTMEIISNSVSLAAGLNKEAVLVEHILLSLIRNQDLGILKVLSELGLDVDDIETELKILIHEDEENLPENISNELPERYAEKYLTPLAKAILEDAKQETIKQGHSSIGTEQILLSLSKKNFNCLATRILNRFGIDEDTLRVETYRIIGKGSGTNHEFLNYTSVVEKSLEYTWIETKKFQYGKVGSGHLLAGITTMDNCTSSYMLKQMNIDPEQVRWDVLYILKNFPNESEPTPTLDEIDNIISPSVISSEISSHYVDI
jgi:ATP-dependent Clp protease ATP-binding subunit ClpA